MNQVTQAVAKTVVWAAAGSLFLLPTLGIWETVPLNPSSKVATGDPSRLREPTAAGQPLYRAAGTGVRASRPANCGPHRAGAVRPEAFCPGTRFPTASAASGQELLVLLALWRAVT